MLNSEETEKYLSSRLPYCRVKAVAVTGSTNSDLKTAAEGGAPEGTVLIAREQTAGRGRLGRSFYSPRDTGLYMSVILRPGLPARECTQITACAAVAVSCAVDRIFSVSTSIKWVNDIYLGGKKICGILTESALIPDGSVKYCVLGIGVNISTKDFPEDISGIAAGITESADRAPELAARILELFFEYYRRLPAREHMAEYRARSLLDGKEIAYFRDGRECRALVTGIDDEARLVVRDSDGNTHTLDSGEVTLHTDNAQ